MTSLAQETVVIGQPKTLKLPLSLMCIKREMKFSEAQLFNPITKEQTALTYPLMRDVPGRQSCLCSMCHMRLES